MCILLYTSMLKFGTFVKGNVNQLRNLNEKSFKRLDR